MVQEQWKNQPSKAGSKGHWEKRRQLLLDYNLQVHRLNVLFRSKKLQVVVSIMSERHSVRES